MKMYCPECGASIEYAAKKPNFCINCGHGFGELKAAVASESSDVDQNEYETIPEAYEDMKGLDVEISAKPAKSYKMEDLLGTLSEDEKAEAPKRKRVNKKKILEEIRREAGAKPKQKRTRKRTK